MSDASLRALERDTSAAGRRRLVLERARCAPRSYEAMEALRLLAFLGDEEAGVATGQARSAMLWGDEAWGGLSVTAAATVRVLQDGWPEAWRLGWRLHLAVTEAFLPEWCDAAHPDHGVISVAEARRAGAVTVESHLEGMRASGRCASVCTETRRRVLMLKDWLATPNAMTEAHYRWAMGSGDWPVRGVQVDNDGWRSVYQGPPAEQPVLPMPELDKASLWRAFGLLLAEGDRLAREPVAQAGGQALTIWLRPLRRRWALAARKALRRFAQGKLKDVVGLEWPGRLA